MMQHEFEERMGAQYDTKEYYILEDIYNDLHQLNKDEFCDQLRAIQNTAVGKELIRRYINTRIERRALIDTHKAVGAQALLYAQKLHCQDYCNRLETIIEMQDIAKKAYGTRDYIIQKIELNIPLDTDDRAMIADALKNI